ncbi:LytR/AlgR family response regulator transcription factor [Flavobacterium urocaniciphilum]|uniref:Two component transcriptional regulator, LytTR family n=1 Tax=Flavobacterium urocaniciphilum TaxID=1299341 RepID=A0A1H9E5Q2_9FLAO|nr:response regulator [Flavobacterium urocaniciphilum]SEQ20947.1 two component transcriptional regulator, LytTR family [Flavobacterium urocaniciphilum]
MTQHPIKILVVEDEYITQKTICNYLTEIGYEVIDTSMNAADAIEIIKSKPVDFVILDINIKGEQNGIWLGNNIAENFNLPHLYLTAYSDTETIKNALQSNPLGYLVKPFQKHDLFTAIEIAILNFNKSQNSNEKQLLVKHNEVYTKINFDSILYIESDKNYLIINCEEDVYRYRSTISDFENIMPNYFIKTHKGFIINTQKVKEFSNSTVIINDNKIPISKSHKDLVLNILHSI